METTLIIIGLVLLTLFGSPLFAIVGAFALVAFASLGIDTAAVIIELYKIATMPTLIAIPLFTFAGYLLSESRSPKRLVDLAQSLFGWMPSGLAIVVLLTCALFTAFTGASGVTIVALGGLLYPILIQERYSERFSLGLVTTSGSLGLLFPPSLPVILYALISGASVDKLFVAGIIPGFLLIAVLSAYSIYSGKKTNVPRIPFNLSNVFSAVKGAAWEIPLPFIIIGGIYSGLFTATEAAAITAFYVLIVEVFIYRDLHLFKGKSVV